MKPKTAAYVELAVLGALIALFLWWIYPRPLAYVPQEDLHTVKQKPVFESVPTEAKAVYVYDMKTGKMIYGKNESLQLPLASLTKLMSALTAATILPDTSKVSVSLDDIQTEGDSGLYANETWDLDRLIDFSLIVSSNDGMSALASVAGAHIASEATQDPRGYFVDRMNAEAKDLGLAQTYFLNPSGLDESTTVSGGYGSARDVAMLVAHILETKPHLLEATTYPELTVDSTAFAHDAVNTNLAIDDIPNILASKTGFTDLSGGNLVVAFDAGLDHPVVITVLGSSWDGRFTDMKALVAETLKYLAAEPS